MRDIYSNVIYTVPDIPAQANYFNRIDGVIGERSMGVDDLGVKGLTCDLSADPNGFVVAISARTENLNPNTRIIVEYTSADVWVNNGLTTRKMQSFNASRRFC